MKKFCFLLLISFLVSCGANQSQEDIPPEVQTTTTVTVDGDMETTVISVVNDDEKQETPETFTGDVLENTSDTTTVEPVYALNEKGETIQLEPLSSEEKKRFDEISQEIMKDLQK